MVESEVERLARSIDESPDPLHTDYTPAVHRLIEQGEAAIPAMLALMLSEKSDTRSRAQRVLEGVTMRQHGFLHGSRWLRPDGEKNWKAFWRELGNLDSDEPLENRQVSIEKWRTWHSKKAVGGKQR